MIFPTLLTDKILNTSSLVKDQNAVIVPLGDGYSTRCGIGTNPFFDIWTIETILKQDDRDTFRLFYKQHGLVKAFTWTSPFGETASYVFDAAPTEINNTVGQYEISYRLREVQESVV